MYWFVFCSGDLVLTKDNQIPESEVPPSFLGSNNISHRLPDLDGKHCCWIDLEKPIQSPSFMMVNLRESFELLPFSHYLMAGKARELIYWHRNTRYCGVCGGPTIFNSDISKKCTICSKEWWPSLAIAIIVAVRRGNELLMVQSKKFKRDYMGLVAGFVETGETLEEAVEREVLEETGIKIENIQYFGSQSWPYPCGLMVGFKAKYKDGVLSLQKSELRKGGWYSSDNMPNIPSKLSIARQLIDDFLGVNK